MSITRRRRIKRLFEQALDAADRAAYLATLHAATREEVEALLRAEEEMEGFLEQPASDGLRETPQPGEEIGGYALTRVIGTGGAGTVFEAVQQRPRRRVALKLMHEARPHREEEAEILARLKHPGIAHVYEAGVWRGRPFFAMEYVEGGRSLVAYADEHDLDVRARLGLFVGVCEAVHHGHQKGVLHRDIKPGNVLVDDAGRPKVIDFGIARGTDGAASAEISGTPPYMSPEQLDPEGDHVDVRSDVFALGVLLYELLTGRLPFAIERATLAEARRVVGNEQPAPMGAHADLEAVVARALQKDLAQRYSSAAALAEDIRRHLRHFPVEARAGGLLYHLGKLARRERLGFGLALTVLVVSVAAALIATRFAVQAETEREEASFQTYVANLAAAGAALRVYDAAEAKRRLDACPAEYRGWEWRHLRARIDESERVVRWPGVLTLGAVGRDGRTLYVGRRHGDPGVYGLKAWDVATGVERFTVPLEKSPYCVAVHGGTIAVGFYSGRLELRDSGDGGLRRTIETGTSVNAIDIHPDGTRLATAGRDGRVREWDLPGGGLRRTIEGHRDRAVSLAYAPRGDRLASGGRDGTIRIWGSDTIVLEGHEESVEDLAWRPDGKRLVSVSRDWSVRMWDVARAEVVRVSRAHAGNVRGVAFRPDGKVFATASWDRTVRLWDGETGRQIEALGGHGREVSTVAFANDQQLVSFAMRDEVRIWRTPRRPAALGHRGRIHVVAYSPDGKRLASGAEDGTVRVWDRATLRLLETHEGPGPVQHVVFSPDGRHLAGAFAARGLVVWSRAGARTVRETATSLAAADQWLYAASGGRVLRVELATGAVRDRWMIGEPVGALALDPAGRRLATGSSGGRIRIHETATGIVTATARVAGGVRTLVWSRQLAAFSSERVLHLLDGETFEPRFALPGAARIGGIALSPDGTRLAAACSDMTVRLWDVASGREVVVLHGHRQQAHCVAWSPDGRELASGDGHKEDPMSTVRLWRAPR